MDSVSKINRAKYTLLILVSIALYCCTPKLIPPIEQDVERGKLVWDECNFALLQKVHKMYINKCGSCHALKLPQSQSEESWRKIIPPMAKKAKLNSEEQDLILHYVLTMRNAKK